MRTFQTSLFQQDNWFIAHCEEVDVATQGGSSSEAAENMQEALALHFDVPENEIQVVLNQICATGTERNSGSQAECSFRQVRFRLEAVGFIGISQNPKHAKFIRQKPGSMQSAVLPHYAQLAKAVVESILRQAGLPEDDFEQESK